MKRITLLTIGWLSASAVGCHDGLGAPSGPVVTFRFLPRELDIAADGGQAAFLIEGHTADGRTVESAPGVLLFVRDTAVASVSGPGLVTGRREGSTYVVGLGMDARGLARDSVLVHVRHFAAP